LGTKRALSTSASENSSIAGPSFPSNSSLIQNLFLDYKDDDGFLYVNYDVENTFGNDDFKKDDIIYLIKDNEPDKNNSYIIHHIEIIKGGNWHDGYDETHYAYLENTKTKLFKKMKHFYISSHALLLYSMHCFL
jgi:hypothetical protein